MKAIRGNFAKLIIVVYRNVNDDNSCTSVNIKEAGANIVTKIEPGYEERIRGTVYKQLNLVEENCLDPSIKSVLNKNTVEVGNLNVKSVVLLNKVKISNNKYRLTINDNKYIATGKQLVIIELLFKARGKYLSLTYIANELKVNKITAYQRIRSMITNNNPLSRLIINTKRKGYRCTI